MRANRTKQRLPILAACAAGLAVEAGPAAAQGSPQIGTLLFGYATSLDEYGPNGSVGGTLAAYALKDGVAGGGLEVGYHYLGSTDSNLLRQGLWQTTFNFRRRRARCCRTSWAA
jgi:hypothetical protein